MNPNIRPYEVELAWTAKDLRQRREEWTYALSETEVAELLSALEHAKSLGKGVPDMTAEHFPLPTLGTKLAQIRDQLERGIGVALIKGVPVLKISKSDAGAIYWGIGRHLGSPIAQNAYGDVLGHVWDLGKDPRVDMTARGYQSHFHLPFHTDSADLVGLLCLRTAKSGGFSSMSSSIAIHNRMLAERPDLLARLYQGLPVDRRGEQKEGDLPYASVPTFAWGNNRLFGFYNRSYVNTSQRLPEAPRLTPEDLEALDYYDKLSHSEELCFDMRLEEGDIQLLNNFSVIHSRTEYEDHPEIDRKRHLLRLWLHTPGMQDVPNELREHTKKTAHWSLNPRAPIYDANEIMGVTTH